jgi:hypothetical protein
MYVFCGPLFVPLSFDFGYSIICPPIYGFRLNLWYFETRLLHCRHDIGALRNVCVSTAFNALFWIWTMQALEIITRDVNHYEAHNLSLLSFYFDILFFSCLFCLSKFGFNALFPVVNPCTGTSWKIYFLIHSYETFLYAPATKSRESY